LSEPDVHPAENGHEEGELRPGWVIAIVATVVVTAIGIVVGAASQSANPHPRGLKAIHAQPEADEQPDPDKPGNYSVRPPPFQTEEVLDSLEETGKPCSMCHNEDLPPNPERRELDTHDSIILRHDEQHRWCLDCHDAQDRDKLRLASGTLIEFSESYRLCGQCHGDKYRDWRAGIHGRRTGNWNGEKEYSLCVNCHWAHAPKFKPFEPLPPPKRPGDIK